MKNRRKKSILQDGQENKGWREVSSLGQRLLELSSSPGMQPGEASQPALQLQCDLIRDTAAQLLSAQASLWLTNDLVFAPEIETNGGSKSKGDVETILLPPSAPMQKAFATRRVCCFAETQSTLQDGAEPAPCPNIGQTGESTARMAAAPLLVRDPENTPGAPLGVLLVERPAGNPFTSQEIELLEGLASQAALALQAGKQVAIERWRISQLSLVQRVGAQIASLRDLDELSRQVTRLILETFNYYYVAIFTVEPGQEILQFRASAGPQRINAAIVEASQPDSPAEKQITPAFVIHIGEGLVGHTAQSGQEILANEVSQEARYRFTDALPETQSEVTLPLRVEDRILGVLDVQSNLPRDFNESDLLVLRALAHNIAAAVEGTRLYSAVHHRAEQLAVVAEISHAITSILDEEALLYEVVALIQKRFGYPYVHLFTVHPGRRKIFYEAGSGSRSQLIKEQGYSIDLDDPEGMIPWVARHGKILLANDVEKEPRYRPSPLPPENTRSELTVPLVFGGNILGVLDVQSDQPEAFGEQDIFVFEALTDNVAVAMRNAYLYRSELWRRQAQDSLREVAGLLSANAGLDQVLEAILTELERSFPSDIAALWLLDEADLETEITVAGQLRLAAFHSAGSLGLDLRVGQHLEDILASHHFAVEADQPTLTASWLTEALSAGKPVIRSPQAPLDPLGSALGFLSTYSAIAAPLRIGEQNLGVLTLANRALNRYGTEALAMTAAFANQAAVAIENTRLFEAAHEQAWVSTVLLQVADATQAMTNLNELLVTVTRITPTLVGIKACAVYLQDEGDAFVPAAATGLTHEQQVEFERWRFAPGDVAALDQLRAEKEPIILHGDAEDPQLSAILFAGLPPEELSATELLVLVPLIARGELLGTFLIDYSNNLPGSANLGALEDLFEEQLAILQGIAHQTAMAVENIRLQKAQKDEAYVSVALLQVAQAVVSSNDLDETLGAIVRITPILVGVKRSIIFLWDERRSAFRLAQAYGVHRGAEGKLYKTGDFPLLDSVRERDSLVALPLKAEEANSPAPDAWTQLLPPSQEQVSIYLESEACLLLAFSLAVKGKVLGVLLVEEPDAGLGGNTLGSQARRLREKRLEITTGITQQAALAIQNDRLQRETVERGRLENEMQLAREIQRAFLPHHLPQLPGWGFSVRWRTAREVGGDFYDVFFLPGRRIGLVIADVADKGMPAALFMTLTRTLVRATVQQTDSPGDVLQRVNDVLVPDAQNGMFVSIVYAVLSPDSGQLVYANAGHNPPLLFHYKSGEIERLGKGGMALGVLEGNSIEERTLSLEPGDYLTFYTDGVTEAFSPEGEMFGEANLQRIIRAQAQSEKVDETAVGAAQEMIDAIDDAVSDFLEDGFLADDLTLLVLKRIGQT